MFLERAGKLKPEDTVWDEDPLEEEKGEKLTSLRGMASACASSKKSTSDCGHSGLITLPDMVKFQLSLFRWMRYKRRIREGGREDWPCGNIQASSSLRESKGSFQLGGMVSQTDFVKNSILNIKLVRHKNKQVVKYLLYWYKKLYLLIKLANAVKYSREDTDAYLFGGFHARWCGLIDIYESATGTSTTKPMPMPKPKPTPKSYLKET